jgi:alpha-beta hydrolase superfamily lysophospholipase
MFLCSLLLGPACGSEHEKEKRTASATAVSTPTPTPQAPPDGRTIRFRAADGKRLRGTLTPGPAPKSPAVVLVHQVDGGPEDWDEFIPYLHETGYGTLAYRSRGHMLLDETLLSRDIAGAVQALRRQPEIDPKRLGVIGASIGATATCWFAGTPGARAVRAFVALSPPNFGTAPKPYRPENLLLLADDDEVSMAKAIADAATTDVMVETTAEYGHGISLLGHEAVRAVVLDQLRARLR